MKEVEFTFQKSGSNAQGNWARGTITLSGCIVPGFINPTQELLATLTEGCVVKIPLMAFRPSA